MSFIGVYVTNPSQEEAEKLGKQLLEKKYIACANYFPIKSAYWWRGKMENTHEIVSLFKTRSENWEKIKEEIKSMHSYETPCIMKLNLEANDEYEAWIMKETE